MQADSATGASPIHRAVHARPSASRAALCLTAAAIAFVASPGEPAARCGLALFVLIGGLWMTQALHLTVTALMVPLLAVLFGLLEVRAALAPFASPALVLFLGGFALAAAFRQQGLDRRAALAVIRLAGGRRWGGVLALFAMTALLSMWMSNSATAAMMLPLAIGLLDQGSDGAPCGPREQAFVLLGMAYSASLGGIGTLVGSPPNAIAAAQAGLDFVDWLRIGLPVVAITMPLMVATLALMLRPRLDGRMLAPEADAAAAGVSRGQRATLAVFACTVAGWVVGAPVARALGLAAETDALVALAAIVALVATGAIGWPAIESQVQWGVLLLFGGGLALSEAMAASGASRMLVDLLVAALRDAPAPLMLLVVLLFVVFLTELISNTAAAALLVPIFAGVSASLGLSPADGAAAVAIAASCGFMLPMGTPPNAIVHATQRVPMATMMRCGLVLNLLCAGVLAGWLIASR